MPVPPRIATGSSGKRDYDISQLRNPFNKPDEQDRNANGTNVGTLPASLTALWPVLEPSVEPVVNPGVSPVNPVGNAL
jgi:hypothetical protein